MNIHLFRHLAGYLFLKAHPGEYEPVRQLLGHKSIKTTVEFYVGLEQEHSFKRYEAVLDSYSAQGGNHVVG
jgi:site-specific recombinase XerD